MIKCQKDEKASKIQKVQVAICFRGRNLEVSNAGGAMRYGGDWLSGNHFTRRRDKFANVPFTLHLPLYCLGIYSPT